MMARAHRRRLAVLALALALALAMAFPPALRASDHEIFRIDGWVSPDDWIRVKAGLGFVSIANLGTAKGRSLNDLQMKFGLSLSPFEPLKR